MTTHHQILIVGGGNAGIAAAAQLLRADKKLNIAILEPGDKHYYMPAWTLVGGGIFNMKATIRDEKDVIPKNTTWIKESVDRFEPDQNRLHTSAGNTYTYDVLIVAAGIQMNWHLVKGLTETLGKNGVTSNYHKDYAPYTWECFQTLRDGDAALFTAPSTPTRCGGAPQKIMYLAGDYCKKKKINAHIEFVSGGSVIFGIKRYADELMKLVQDYKIDLHFKHDLVEVAGPNRVATFRVTAPDGSTSEVKKTFKLLHVVPPQSAPDFIKESPLADEKGWVDVDKFTLQHKRFANVFSLGDVTNTPNAKTGAAIRKQTPVLVKNILSFLQQQPLAASYSGYGSCPLVAGYDKLILAEFGYDNKVMETFPFDQSKPRWSMFILKKYILPWLYWNKILKGQM
ncbi:MAG TPA: FAD/NAD(P)-binding oxidoreductase [Lacibacter sp.]|nr:FAD/NAD(P)-binding oxidoreductase [Lacibacter sp.]HMO88222.1 FAD/NAD(P)-binding oxidoreductase [Lacibacter sp.]HMP87750.1 FAD/NAD(P)-binding oxidoreductase [Lacibacter sp.]